MLIVSQLHIASPVHIGLVICSYRIFSIICRKIFACVIHLQEILEFTTIVFHQVCQFVFHVVFYFNTDGKF